MKKGVLLALLILVLSGCASNQPNGPYGFKWSQTPEDIRKLKLDETQCTEFDGGGALCSTKSAPQQKGNQLFLLMFSRESNQLALISVQGISSQNQDEILAEYDRINQQMYEQYGLPLKAIERYKRSAYFLDKISDDESTPYKKVYEKEGVRIMVTIVSNAHFRKIHDRNDLVYSVMTIHSLIPN